MKIRTKLAIALTAMFGLAAIALAQDAPPSPVAPGAAATLPPASTKTNVTYTVDIKPIFDASCTRCHGAQRPGAGVVLTSLQSVLKGGKDGKIIVVGDSTKGPLIKAVAHIGDPQSFMPRGRNVKALTPDQIGLIRAWIDQGAK